jgi:hypothetical protein
MGFETCWWLFLKESAQHRFYFFAIKSKYTETGLQSSLICAEAEASVPERSGNPCGFQEQILKQNQKNS